MPRKRWILLVLPTLLCPTLLNAQDPGEMDEAAIRERAASVMAAIVAGDADGLLEHWSPDATEQLSPERVLSAWGTVITALGEPGDVPEADVTFENDRWTAAMMVPFDATPLLVRLIFDDQGHIVGVGMGG